MSANLFFRTSDTWGQLDQVFVRDSTAWKRCAFIYVYDAAAASWRLIYFDLLPPEVFYTFRDGNEQTIGFSNYASAVFDVAIQFTGTYTVDFGFGPTTTPVDIIFDAQTNSANPDDQSVVWQMWNYGGAAAESYNLTVRYLKGNRVGPGSPLILEY